MTSEVVYLELSQNRLLPQAIEASFLMALNPSFCPNTTEMRVLSSCQITQDFEESSLQPKLRRGHGDLRKEEGIDID